MLSGPQRLKLRNLILDCFNPQSFEMLLADRLDRTLDHYTAPMNGFRDQTFNVLRAANHEGWEEDLMLALLSERPKHAELVSFIASFRLGSNTVYQNLDTDPINSSGLEALVNNNPMLPGYVFVARLLERMKCICRIESVNLAGVPIFGTGFLVGPDLVLTNYHVMEWVIRNPALTASVVCKFDFFMKTDGSVHTGIDVGLSNQPILAHSPYCNLDNTGSPSVEAAWPADQLDYALLRLNRSIGQEPFGIKAENSNVDQENIRGWIKQGQADANAYKSGGDIIIIQHPQREPIKIAMGLGRVVGTDSNFRRVRYNVNTIGGSSGSPGFDKELTWTVLHNMGDPNRNPQYNQGIPAQLIINDLNRLNITLPH